MRIIPKEEIRKEALSLKENGYDFLSFITAIDRNNNFEVVYLFRNLNENKEEFIKCIVPKDEPKIPTISDIFFGANWHEREVYDLFGIIFEGHPDLRRILLPEDYEGHPLRKDFPMHMEYEPYRSGDWLVNHENKEPAKRKK
ncbi:MAG: NADH-quinone oxidoreductase subunit C [candidate division WOR-3 bacterium]|jgi:NADH-quinone oxidoreductase subunit C